MRKAFAGTAAWMTAVLITAALWGELPARWPEERDAPPFRCHADFSLADYASLFADMRELETDVLGALALTADGQPIDLFLFDRKSTYHQYVSHYFPEVPKRPALFIKSRGHAMVFAHRGPEFAVDVRHECAHAVLHAALPMVPLWLDEGIAEYFEVARGERTRGHPSMAGMRWTARFGRVPDLESLEALVELRDMTSTHYKQAWAWVHFLLHGPPEARDELRAYLADIAARTPPDVLSRRLRRRMPDLESRFLSHFRAWQRD